MRRNQIEDGRISNHFGGLGTVTREMVLRRAREMAVINGRSAREVLDSDFDQARRELTGEGEMPPQEEVIESLPESERWDPVPGGTGRKAPKYPPDEDQTENEKLVHEGMEEAEHDQMFQGSRRDWGS